MSHRPHSCRAVGVRDKQHVHNTHWLVPIIIVTSLLAVQITFGIIGVQVTRATIGIMMISKSSRQTVHWAVKKLNARTQQLKKTTCANVKILRGCMLAAINLPRSHVGRAAELGLETINAISKHRRALIVMLILCNLDWATSSNTLGGDTGLNGASTSMQFEMLPEEMTIVTPVLIAARAILGPYDG